jgi:GxxExxY protein
MQSSQPRVHSELGPSLLESTYTACLRYELAEVGVWSLPQVALPVVYRGVKLDLGYRMDLLVENLVVVELKAVDAVSPFHQAQLLSYLKLSGKSLGLLINFNVVHRKDGIRRFVNGTGWKQRRLTTKDTKSHEGCDSKAFLRVPSCPLWFQRGLQNGYYRNS